MFNLWKQHALISYYTIATIIASLSGIAYWVEYLAPKPLSILLGFSIGIAFFQISARMMIIFLTATISFITLSIYNSVLHSSLILNIFGIVTAMLVGYSLTFSKGRWFVVLYAISLAIVSSIAAFFELFLPVH